MSAQWVTAAIAAAGLIGNLFWTLINLRIENKLLQRIDQLKDWADARYVLKTSAPTQRVARS